MVRSGKLRGLSVTTAKEISNPANLLTAAKTATSSGVPVVTITQTVRFVIVSLSVTTAKDISDPANLIAAAKTATSSGVPVVTIRQTVRFVNVKNKQGSHTYIATCTIGVDGKTGNLHHNEPSRIAQ